MKRTAGSKSSRNYPSCVAQGFTMFQLQLSTLATITPSDFILATVEAVSSEDAAYWETVKRKNKKSVNL